MSDGVLVGFIVAVWGVFVSWVEERFGAFDNLPPNVKQLVNAFLAWLVPLLLTTGWFAWWQPEFGNLSEVLTAFGIFVVPVLYSVVGWISSQVAHYADKYLAKATK